MNTYMTINKPNCSRRWKLFHRSHLFRASRSADYRLPHHDQVSQNEKDFSGFLGDNYSMLVKG